MFHLIVNVRPMRDQKFVHSSENVVRNCEKPNRKFVCHVLNETSRLSSSVWNT